MLGNHEQFTDHFMVDWQLSGPKRGVGAKANVKVKATAEKDGTESRSSRRTPAVGSSRRRPGGSSGKRRTRAPTR